MRKLKGVYIFFVGLCAFFLSFFLFLFSKTSGSFSQWEEKYFIIIPFFTLLFWALSSWFLSLWRKKNYITVLQNSALSFIFFLILPLYLFWQNIFIGIVSGLGVIFLKILFSYKPLSESKLKDIMKKCIWYIIIPLIIFILTYNFRFLYGTNMPMTMFEEGEHFAWANEILNGKFLGKDIFCLYGPFLEGILVILMKLFGPTVSTGRFFYYVFYLGGLGAILGYLLINRFYFTAFFKIVFLLLLLREWYFLNIRLAIPLFALFFIDIWLEKKQKRYIFVAGVLTSFSLLFSQEYGFAIFLSLNTILLAMLITQVQTLKQYWESFKVYMVGVSAFVFPFCFYYLSKGALFPFIRNLINYPVYVTKGYANLPYPGIPFSFHPLFSAKGIISGINALGTCIFRIFYFPLVIFCVTAIYLTIKFILKKFYPKDYIILGFFIFGMLTIKVGLGRSDIGHAGIYTPPALMIFTFLLERIYFRWKTLKNLSATKIVKVERFFLPFILIMSLFYLASRYNVQKIFVQFLNKYESWGKQPQGYRKINIKRGGAAFFPIAEADYLEEISKYIIKNTKEKEPIFIFSNEPIFYFLTNRPNATRFHLIAFAITTEHRKEIIKDLKRVKPRYIIYSPHNCIIDNIPHEKIAPKVANYIRKNYTVVEIFDRTYILKLIEAGEQRSVLKQEFFYWKDVLLIDLGNPKHYFCLEKGWSIDPNVSYVWATEKEATLWFLLKNTEDYEMTIKMTPFLFPNAPFQHVKIEVNDKFLTEVKLKKISWQKHKIFLPKLFLRKGKNMIKFSFTYNIAPCEVSNNPDKRTLSVAFDYIKLIKVNNKKVRYSPGKNIR
jgi:hypothetical protein